MTRRTPSLWQFLEHNVKGRDSGRYSAIFREQLDRSELLATMGRIADTVNFKAGELLIDVQSYLPPEALVRSFCLRGHGVGATLAAKRMRAGKTIYDGTGS